MVSLFWACGFKPNTPIFVFHVSLKESIIFISFYYKIWRYDDVTSALLQNQIIVILCSIFLKCPNKVWCLVNGGFYPQHRLTSFEKNIKNRYLVPCLPIVVVEQHNHISSINDFSQKSLFGLLNHFWYKPKTIKLFFSMNSLGWVKERVNGKLYSKNSSVEVV